MAWMRFLSAALLQRERSLKRLEGFGVDLVGCSCCDGGFPFNRLVAGSYKDGSAGSRAVLAGRTTLFEEAAAHRKSAVGEFDSMLTGAKGLAESQRRKVENC